MSDLNFESFVKETIENNIQETLNVKEELPKTPIEKFHLFAMQESTALVGMIIESGDVRKEFANGVTPELDEYEVNDLVETFCEKWDMDTEEYELYFSNPYDVPVCLYWAEMIKAVREIVAGLKKKGIEFSKSAEVGVYFEDDYSEDIGAFKSMAFEQLDKFPESAAVREFFELFYAKKDSVDALMEDMAAWKKKI